MSKIHIYDHPLIDDKITKLRDANTKRLDFKELITEITMLMAFESTKDLETELIDVTTPITTTKQPTLKDNIVIVPILRAGLGMVSGIEKIMRKSRIAHVGMYRDEETFQIHPYYQKFPNDMENSIVYIVDPMLATGASAVEAINIVKEQKPLKIKFMAIVGVSQGIDLIQKNHPDVEIYLATKDEILNENNYIVPGVGDAGDRIFGTK